VSDGRSRITYPLYLLFKKSLNTDTVIPDNWKQAIVTPIYSYKDCIMMSHLRDFLSLHDPPGRASSLGKPNRVSYPVSYFVLLIQLLPDICQAAGSITAALRSKTWVCDRVLNREICENRV